MCNSCARYSPNTTVDTTDTSFQQKAISGCKRQHGEKIPEVKLSHNQIIFVPIMMTLAPLSLTPIAFHVSLQKSPLQNPTQTRITSAATPAELPPTIDTPQVQFKEFNAQRGIMYLTNLALLNKSKFYHTHLRTSLTLICTSLSCGQVVKISFCGFLYQLW